ncbi:MAG: tetratricopeptide repeat protein, partial [Patescibacteria group bacterium]|nr:tetratricopeptide repeat protein [Patescibacteria group bacterium]
YQNLLDATKLIDENLKLGDNETDRRMKVALDQAHPSRATREKAIESLEQMVARQGQKAPGDVLGLAQLYLAAGNWEKARPLLQDLVTDHPSELRYLASLIEAMVKHGEDADAQPYLDKLVAAAPNNLGTVSLQAEALFRKGEHQQVLDLLNEFIDRSGAEPEDRSLRLRVVAGVMEQFIPRLREAGETAMARQFTDAAEALYRRYVQALPEHELLLAAFLARQGRTAEAVDMLERRWSSLDQASLAQMAILLLKSDAATESHVERTERIIARALEQNPDSVPIHLLLANWRTEQERYAEAEKHYRAVLRVHPDHAIALNNLAVLLALQGVKLEEAAQMVNRAIKNAGPIASLLDSRATIYKARGEYDKALVDIDKAIAEDASPVWLFHRAQILFRAGKKQGAAQSLAKARAQGLTSEMLQPLERAEYEKLQRSLQ